MHITHIYIYIHINTHIYIYIYTYIYIHTNDYIVYAWVNTWNLASLILSGL